MTEPFASASPDPPAVLRAQFLFRLSGRVGPPFEVGGVGGTERRIAPIEGGGFEGPRLRGDVLPSGADWMRVRGDDVVEIDVRALLRTHDGALIYLRYGGYRHGPPEVMAALARGEAVDPRAYYFRVAPVFETGAPGYAWLNSIVSVGTGRRLPQGPVYDFFEIR